MKIAIRFGHQTTGQDGGAIGLVKETDVNRRYGALSISKFQSLGHEVLNVTPPEANRSLSNSLMYGIDMANDWGADLFISCHVNASEDTDYPMGCEVVCSGSGTGLEYANRISNELANLGFKNRGAKQDERGLAEIRRTNMPCVIVEPFFLDSSADVSIYNKVGDEGIATAIVKGITGQTVSSQPKYSPDFIKSVQHDLQRVSCLEGGEGVVTGQLDNKTKNAIAQFKYVVNLPCGSNIDDQLITVLNIITHKPIVGEGWSSNPIPVKFIQWYLGLPKTGVVDSQMTQAIKIWQVKAGIWSQQGADGILREKDWNKILK